MRSANVLHMMRSSFARAVASKLHVCSSSGYDGDYEAASTGVVESTLRYIGASAVELI